MKYLAVAALAAFAFAQDDVNSTPAWTHDEAEISRALSNYAYCGHKVYMTLDYEGSVAGF